MTITIAIVLITIGVSFYAWNKEEVMSKLIMDPIAINKKGEYFRLVTSGFIHADYFHLFFNMFALYSFGQMVEYTFMASYGALGGFMYVAFYLAALVASDLPTYLKNKNNYRYSCLGASGGVSALIIACVLFDPFNPNYSFFFIRMPAILMGTLYIAYSYFMSSKQFDNINHDSHLHGAYFGIIATVILFPEAVVNFYHSLLALF
jgi:membrane associated rhomboid family serine protease